MPTEAPEAPVETTPEAPEIVIEAPKEVTPEKPKPLWGQIKVGEKPAEEKTPEPKKQDEVAPEKKAGGKEESLSNLRKKLEEQEKELEDYRGKYSTIEKEYNEFKTKPVELPEEVKTKLTKAEQERDEYLREIRAVRIEKDPEFVDRYVKPIQNSISTMQKVAAEAGVEVEALKAGFGRWDENTFGEWMEVMSPGQKAKFSAAWMEAERLEQERVSKITDANKTYEEMTKAREQEAKSRYEADMSNNEKLAKTLVKKLIIDNESTKEFEDLPGVAEAVAMKVARYEVSPQEVIEAMVSNQALARMHGKQKSIIEERDATIADLKKQLEERDSFIKEHGGATPRPDASGVIGKSNGEKVTPLWDIRIAPR